MEVNGKYERDPSKEPVSGREAADYDRTRMGVTMETSSYYDIATAMTKALLLHVILSLETLGSRLLLSHVTKAVSNS